ncbi:MAG: NAD(P)-dependent oxidoreductase [Spirochaetales bacterium]|nr:NAD(P)-dependent oxidoreductase [Spirochaetales bacterium]
MDKKRILVIGGSGFIGTELVRVLLESGNDVRIVDKKMSTTYPELCIICDVRDKPNLHNTCKGYDILYNLAAEHKDNVTPVSLYEEVNIGGARNVCEVAEETGIKKIIFTSSVAVYGFSNKEITEDHTLHPFNEYGRTKMEAEKVYKAWQEKSKEHSLVIVRSTVVFGERNRGNVYNLIKQITSNHFIMVGNGKNKKSLAYIDNVVMFLHYILRFGPGFHLYNYIDKPDMDMNTLVYSIKSIIGYSTKNGFRLPYSLGFIGGKIFDILSFISGKKFSISSIRIKKFCENTLFSSKKMLTSGFTPPHTIKTGLEKTIRNEFLIN